MRYALCMLLCGFLVGLSALPARTQESAKQSWGEQALVAYANGDKARARILAQRALAEGKAQATLSHFDMMVLSNLLGHLHQELGDLPAAQKYFEDAIAAHSQLGPKDQDPYDSAGHYLAAIRQSLARLYAKIGRVDDAEKLFAMVRAKGSNKPAVDAFEVSTDSGIIKLKQRDWEGAYQDFGKGLDALVASKNQARGNFILGETISGRHFVYEGLITAAFELYSKSPAAGATYLRRAFEAAELQTHNITSAALMKMAMRSDRGSVASDVRPMQDLAEIYQRLSREHSQGETEGLRAESARQRKRVNEYRARLLKAKEEYLQRQRELQSLLQTTRKLEQEEMSKQLAWQRGNCVFQSQQDQNCERIATERKQLQAELAKLPRRSAEGISDGRLDRIGNEVDAIVEELAEPSIFPRFKGGGTGDLIMRVEMGLDQLLASMNDDAGFLAWLYIKIHDQSTAAAKQSPQKQPEPVNPAPYSERIDPIALGISTLQALLKPDEVLVNYFVGSERSFVWGIGQREVVWSSIPKTTLEIGAMVSALRCGLDATVWDYGPSASACSTVLNAKPTKQKMGDVLEEVLPFDLGRAHRLYKELLAPLERLISGKQLLIVPSGPLATLPLQVMLTEEPKTTIPQSLLEYRQAAWLGSRQPMIMLPTVASLKALREIAKPSKAPKPYLGIGNPLLDGPQSDPKWGGYYKQQAKLAREKRCPAHSSDLKIASTGGRKPLDGFDRLWRGTHADLAQLRLQTPLPETADELCEIARGLGVSQNDILLGEAATEAKVKDLSEQGRLADYAILHFATHGALGGEVLGSAEPGLILTPPAKADADSTALDRDDGFLTSSEIASLKLDADWVILSACNTAAGQNQTSEALSGMARAFFYAGARGLLVSHWAVSSGAAVKLTTRAFDELRTKPDIARAEAFRVSIRELIQNGNTFDAHPSQWAPFVLVGTGAH